MTFSGQKNENVFNVIIFLSKSDIWYHSVLLIVSFKPKFLLLIVWLFLLWFILTKYISIIFFVVMDIIQGLLIYTKILAADCVIFILIRVLKKGETIPRRNKKQLKVEEKQTRPLRKKPKKRIVHKTLRRKQQITWTPLKTGVDMKGKAVIWSISIMFLFCIERIKHRKIQENTHTFIPSVYCKLNFWKFS